MDLGLVVDGGGGDGSNDVSRLRGVRLSTTVAVADNDQAQAHVRDRVEKVLDPSWPKAGLGVQPAPAGPVRYIPSSAEGRADMGTLREKLGNGGSREKIIEDGIKMIDAEVSDKGGLGGLAIKGAYAMVKGIAPGIMPKLLNGMLDDFLDALSPFYDEAAQKGADFKQSITQQQSVVANALLSVTDQRAQKSSAGPLKKGYEKLRPTAQKHVEQALPRLADFVKSFAG